MYEFKRKLTMNGLVISIDISNGQLLSQAKPWIIDKSSDGMENMVTSFMFIVKEIFLTVKNLIKKLLNPILKFTTNCLMWKL